MRLDVESASSEQQSWGRGQLGCLSYFSAVWVLLFLLFSVHPSFRFTDRGKEDLKKAMMTSGWLGVSVKLWIHRVVSDIGESYSH